MHKTQSIAVLLAFLLAAAFSSSAMAEENCSREAVTNAINEAVQILETQGAAGLEAVGELSFCGDNYVFVNDLKGKTLMHVKRTLIGKVLIGLKDDTGKRFFADFSQVAKSSQTDKSGVSYYNGSGWVEYRWPKPGQKEFSPKQTYIKGCLMDGENVYVGAGIYEE